MLSVPTRLKWWCSGDAHRSGWTLSHADNAGLQLCTRGEEEEASHANRSSLRKPFDGFAKRKQTGPDFERFEDLVLPRSQSCFDVV